MKKNTYRDDLTPPPVEVIVKNDPKYSFVNGRIWSVNGSYWIPEDEPVMVLRGKDQAVIAAIFGYLECLQKQEPKAHVMEHIRTSTERLKEITRFQVSRPDFVGIGCGIDEKLRG